MPRKCSICEHSKSEEINKCLVNGNSLRDIAKQFSVSKAAVDRHKNHLPQILVKAQEAVKVGEANNVLTELQRCFERVNRLFDACDEWLKDANDPTKYDINPRSDDVMITYLVPTSDGKTIKKKDRMSYLLARIENAGYVVDSWESTSADPRLLILKTAGQLSDQIEVLAKVIILMEQENRLSKIEEEVSKKGGINK